MGFSEKNFGENVAGFSVYFVFSQLIGIFSQYVLYNM